jgi:CTP-dependent riboflavin kinase
MVVLRGRVVSGAMRGSPLIDKYFYRLVTILKFEPFRGTMDIHLDKPIDLNMYATKDISHILMDGFTKHVDAVLAPVKIRYDGHESECWAIRQAEGIHGNDVVEIIGKDCFKEKHGLKDNDVVELEFTEIVKPLRIDKLKKFVKKSK